MAVHSLGISPPARPHSPPTVAPLQSVSQPAATVSPRDAEISALGQAPSNQRQIIDRVLGTFPYTHRGSESRWDCQTSGWKQRTYIQSQREGK